MQLRACSVVADKPALNSPSLLLHPLLSAFLLSLCWVVQSATETTSLSPALSQAFQKNGHPWSRLLGSLGLEPPLHSCSGPLERVSCSELSFFS